jgi:hypothetical protein
MRGFKIICGVAVVFMALHMVHAIHHFVDMKSEMPAAMWVSILVAGVAMNLLSFAGGILLVTGK